MLGKDGENQLHRLCEKWNITEGERGKEYSTYNKKKESYVDWSYID